MEELKGQIQKITYCHPDSGFTIAQIRIDGQLESATAVGNLTGSVVGETLTMQGQWVRHPTYGPQFKVHSYSAAVPVTPEGMVKYLSSGLIDGIGQELAQRIVDRFGEQTLDVIDNRIDRLTEVSGIGPKRLAQITQAWKDHHHIRDTMLFLQGHGIGARVAAKICHHYGDGTISIVRQNPYQLAGDIFGIGFVTADQLAAKLGFASDSPVRVQAGLLHVLEQVSTEGHVFFPRRLLMEQAVEILKVPHQTVISALDALVLDQQVIVSDLNRDGDTLQAVYLASHYHCETHLGRRLIKLMATSHGIASVESGPALKWIQDQLTITLAAKQQQAIRWAVENKALVVTGGPGTGKTTIINAILKLYHRMGVKTLMAAPHRAGSETDGGSYRSQRKNDPSFAGI